MGWNMFIHNLVVLFILSLANTIASICLPITFFHYDGWLYRERRWERSGEFYQSSLKVKRWKNVLPELSDFLRFLFPKKRIRTHTPQYIYRFVLETCRAELAHWCIIFSSLLFFLWTTPGMSLLMIAITIIINMPYIVIQRFNRPRLLKILFAGRIHNEMPLQRGVGVSHS